jgi:hypothetical protein
MKLSRIIQSRIKIIIDEGTQNRRLNRCSIINKLQNLYEIIDLEIKEANQRKRAA